MSFLLCLCFSLALLAPSLAYAQAALGIPGNGVTLSGSGVLSGWKCEVNGPLVARFFNNAGDPPACLDGSDSPVVRQ